jgi:hypothetical protein
VDLLARKRGHRGRSYSSDFTSAFGNAEAAHPIALLLRAPRAATQRKRRHEAQMLRAASFDHFVGSREQRWRNVEAERLGGLEIDPKRHHAPFDPDDEVALIVMGCDPHGLVSN